MVQANGRASGPVLYASSFLYLPPFTYLPLSFCPPCSGGVSGEGGGVTTYEMKQLEQQNDRLKEAVMKFRDLSQHEKQENVRLVKVGRV